VILLDNLEDFTHDLIGLKLPGNPPWLGVFLELENETLW
jgi:hypothetical protein